MSEATQLAERALYRLSLDPQARTLAERLLERFRGMGSATCQPAPSIITRNPVVCMSILWRLV